jgi:hypothetical protein
MHWSTLRCVRSLLLILAWGAAVASADTITEDANGFYDASGYDGIVPPGDSLVGFLDFPAFNKSLGNLNSATIDWVVSLSEYEIYGSYPNYGDPVPYSVTQTAMASTGNYSCGNVNYTTYDSATLTTSGTFTPSGDSEYDFGNRFTLSGKLVIPANCFYDEVETFASAQVTGPSSNSFSTVDSGYARYSFGVGGTVTYDYTAVPEPRSAIALLAAAMLIAAAVIRHRFQACVAVKPSFASRLPS